MQKTQMMSMNDEQDSAGYRDIPKCVKKYSIDIQTTQEQKYTVIFGYRRKV